MRFRQSLAYLNLLLFGAAIAAQLLLPAYSGIIFLGLVGWMIASFVIFYGPGASRALGRPQPAAAAAPRPVDVPLPSGPPTRVGFCVYCGTELPTDAAICPSCGRVPRPI